MNAERIDQLTRYIEEEPKEPFNVYALAIEYMDGQPEQARLYFDRLLTEHPAYLPTYYHAANLYTNLDDRDKAAELYEKGINLARVQNNEKTLQELQRAQLAFEDDEDEW